MTTEQNSLDREAERRLHDLIMQLDKYKHIIERYKAVLRYRKLELNACRRAAQEFGCNLYRYNDAVQRILEKWKESEAERRTEDQED